MTKPPDSESTMKANVPETNITDDTNLDGNNKGTQQRRQRCSKLSERPEFVSEGLSKIEVPDFLKKPRKKRFPWPVKYENLLSDEVVYEKLKNGEFFLSPPEATKMRGIVASMWLRGFLLILEKGSDGKLVFTGHVIHHVTSEDGTYCGKIYHQRKSPFRTSDTEKHLLSECHIMATPHSHSIPAPVKPTKKNKKRKRPNSTLSDDFGENGLTLDSGDLSKIEFQPALHSVGELMSTLDQDVGEPGIKVEDRGGVEGRKYMKQEGIFSNQHQTMADRFVQEMGSYTKNPDLNRANNELSWRALSDFQDLRQLANRQNSVIKGLREQVAGLQMQVRGLQSQIDASDLFLL